MDQVRKIVQLIDDVLGRTVIGIYLHGSAVLGGLKPASDLDVLVISRRGMDDRERRALLRRLLEVSGFVGGARPVELTFARIWSTLATGEIRSKDDAADWALTRSPPEHRPALAHAKALYLCHRYSEDRWSDELKANARPYIEHLLVEIDRLSNR